MGDLLGLAAALLATSHNVEREAERHGFEKACRILEDSAKNAIGTYTFGWTPLAESTLKRKAGDTPLYETGALQASITHFVGHMEAWVGSNDPKAVWQEFGTSRIPPRPYLGGALNAKHSEVMACFTGILSAAIAW